MSVNPNAEWDLGDDSIARNALKALQDADVTPAAAAAMTPKALAAIPGLGQVRLERVQQNLARLERADAGRQRAERLERQKTKPGYCPDCGQPRADHPRNIVTDHRGHLRALAGFRAGGPRPEPSGQHTAPGCGNWTCAREALAIAEQLCAGRDQFAATVAALVEQANTMRAELEQQRAPNGEMREEWGHQAIRPDGSLGDIVINDSEESARVAMAHMQRSVPNVQFVVKRRIVWSAESEWRNADAAASGEATQEAAT